MIVAELAHLLVGHPGEPLGAEPQRRAPQAGHCLDVLAPGFINDAATLATGNDQRPILLMLAQVRLHVHDACDVARLNGVRNVGHGASSSAAASCSWPGPAMPYS